MRNALRWTTSIILLLTVLLIPTTGMAQTISHETVTASCADVHVIAARGSGQPKVDNDSSNPQNMGQPLADVLASFKKQMSEKGYTVSGEAVLYDASKVTNPPTAEERVKLILKSVPSGIKLLRKATDAQAKRCPDKPIILAAYSQGAAVIHATMKGGRLSKAAKSKIKAVLLYGDPSFSPKDSYNRGNFEQLSGVAKDVSLVKGFPSWFTGKARSYCIKGDLVCNSSKKNDETCRDGKACPHSEYTARKFEGVTYARHGANWLASLFKKKSKTPTPTPTPEPVPTPDKLIIEKVTTQDAQGRETDHFTCGDTIQLMVYYTASPKVHVVIRFTVFGKQLPTRGEVLTGSGRYRIDSGIPSDVHGEQTFTAAIDYSRGTVSASRNFTVSCGTAL